MACHRVTVLPADVVLEVDEEDDLYWAARSAGWRWPTSCDGNCECGQCNVTVLEGAENVSPPTAEEQARLAAGLTAGKEDARLACRMFFDGDVVVRCRGARPPRSDDGAAA